MSYEHLFAHVGLTTPTIGEMGHNRLGELPKTREWREVVALLDGGTVDPAALAGAVIAAAAKRLQLLRRDEALADCVWLLVRLASAARRPDFVDELVRLGLRISPDIDAVTFVELVADRAEERASLAPPSGHFGEIAQLSLRVALMETVGHHGRTLFGTPIEDLKQAVAAHATTVHFGELAHAFFADFFGRSLRAIVDRELAEHVGKTRAFATLANAVEFQRALDLHARQSARIVERAAGEWFSKHHWEREGDIPLDDVRGLVQMALRKLSDELLLQGAAA